MHQRTRTSVFLLALACAAAGCAATGSFIPTGDPALAREPRPPEQVEVFTAGPPARPFAELGMLEAQQSADYPHLDPPEDLLAQMRREAGQRGCDGLVITGPNDAVVTVTKDEKDSVRTLKGFRGTCIVFTDTPSGTPGAAQTAAPGAAPGALAPAAQCAAPAGERMCVPNETRLCHGPGACHGGQSCLPDGSGFTECDCGPPPPRAPGGGAHH